MTSARPALARTTCHDGRVTLPIHYIVPLARETRWSDLLAVLIEADPHTGFRALGLDPPQGGVTVEREAPSAGRDRIDLLVHDRAGARAVVEVKVLSGLDHRQLERYAEAFPQLSQRVLVLARLPSSLPAASAWESLTWEDVLEQFAQSGNDWVATTARAWRKDLEHRVPRVSTGTIWNEIPAGDDLVLPLRARMAWVFGQLRPPPGVEHDLVESSAGKSWVARMTTQARAENYLIRAEAEESLRGAVTTLRGPRVKICLVQTGVDSSRDFDWDYLLALWAIMAPTRDDWRGSPNPRPSTVETRPARGSNLRMAPFRSSAM